MRYPSERHHKLSLVSRLFLFQNFAQSTALSVPCSVQHLKNDSTMTWIFWANEVSRDLSLTHWSLGDWKGILNSNNWCLRHILWNCPQMNVIWVLMIIKSILVQATSHYLSQCWPDLCRHMASLGHNELTCVSGRYPILHSPKNISSHDIGQFRPN